MSVATLEDEMALLSSIPNYHWCSPSTKTHHVGFPQHLLYHPESHEDDMGCIKFEYQPPSPRNQLMLFVHNWTDIDFHTKVRTMVKNLLAYDSKEDKTQQDLDRILLGVGDDSDIPSQPPGKKRRRRNRARIVTATPAAISSHLGVDLADNSAQPDRSMYTKFAEELATDGVIHWRQHSGDTDVVALNDYCMSSGDFLPSSFVHVTSHTNDIDPEKPLLKCSCQIYNEIQNATVSNIQLDPDEEVYLDPAKLTCMHCRFYQDQLKDIPNQQLEGGDLSSNLLSKVKETWSNLGEPVIVIGSVLPHTCTKLSVVGEDGGNYAFIHITFEKGICYAKCQNGKCQAQLRNKKKIPKSLDIRSVPRSSCQHLHNLMLNIEYTRSLFPDHFNNSEDDPHPFPQGGGEDINTLDEEVRSIPASVSFDTIKGLWVPNSLSKHKPMSMTDPVLVSKTAHRITYIKDENFIRGAYCGEDLVPHTAATCQCGADYEECEDDFTTKVYTRNVSIKFNNMSSPAYISFALLLCFALYVEFVMKYL
jgi:hypothetical protein